MEMILVGLGAAALLIWGFFRDKKEGEEDATFISNLPDSIPLDVRRFASVVAEVSVETGVSESVLLAVLWQESAGDVFAQGSFNEYGLMQMTNIAARDVGRESDWEDMVDGIQSRQINPKRQISLGADYLRKCYTDYAQRNWERAFKCYNGGPPPWTGTELANVNRYSQSVEQKRKTIETGKGSEDLPSFNAL